MLMLQRAFSQLRLVVNAAAENTILSASHSVTRLPASQQMLLPKQAMAATVCQQGYSTKVRVKKNENSSNPKDYEPPSPYRNPGPRRYGYEPRFYTGGPLPRGLDTPIRSLPQFKVKDSWNKKRALFGQNDYIDILGDGSIRPGDLMHGPDWLIGFKGNELQRLKRRLMFHGTEIKNLYPSKYDKIQRRIFFLYKKYNRKRGKRVTGA